jgi:hypothetical protein
MRALSSSDAEITPARVEVEKLRDADERSLIAALHPATWATSRAEHAARVL